MKIKLATRLVVTILNNLYSKWFFSFNRPSEMVRLKIEDFDLDARTVNVWLKKQKTWHNKRVTQDVVKER